MSNNTTIKLKRTAEEISSSSFQNHKIAFGEPIFVDNNELIRSSSCKSYIVLGSNVTSDKQVKNAAIFKGFWDINKANSIVFYNENREGIVDELGQQVYVDKVISSNAANTNNDSYRYYLLCQPKMIADPNGVVDIYTADEDYRSVKFFNMGDAGIYIDSKGVFYGAAWNDYAETRKVKGLANPGDVVCESGDGTLELSSCRLQPCPYVISDTFGMTIGSQNDTPVAISGRVLVKMYDEKCVVGDCVCAGVDGKATVMSREEIKEYPDRILGIITEIPEYEDWNGVKINNRVWIKVR